MKQPPLIVIGLDGLTWDTVRRVPNHIMPNLKNIYFNSFGWKIGLLHIDGIAHSAPSWTTIFTGVATEQHGIVNWHKPVANGKWGEMFMQHDLRQAFVWEILEQHGVATTAFNIYAFTPPIAHNVHYSSSMSWSHDLTIDDLKLIKYWEEMRGFIER